MPGLIECVPNFSEGRRPEVVEEIVRAIGQIDGVTVLDHSRDETHNRSVVTFAGSAEPVVRAATAGVGRALELIDMEQHTGAHPRIGAVDVIPFVPLGGTRIEECVDLARRFGEQIALRFELPVYLYGEAALRPERRRLADVRRGQYEAIRDEIGTTRSAPPTSVRHGLHPRGGAVAVGARKPLIAFNINLRTDELAVAIKIATTIRECSGGMPAVQAMGVLLENPGEPPMAQVSMNLVDWERTGIAAVVREVRRLAREAGTDIDHCELIGLAPTGALLEVAADALGLRDFTRRPGARAAPGPRSLTAPVPTGTGRSTIWHTACIEVVRGERSTKIHTDREIAQTDEAQHRRRHGARRPNRILVALAAAWMILSLAIGGAHRRPSPPRARRRTARDRHERQPRPLTSADPGVGPVDSTRP